MLNPPTVAIAPRPLPADDDAARRDLEMLESLVSEHAARAWRVAHALTGDDRTAEGVVQAVVAALLDGPPGDTAPRSLAVHVCRLAVTAVGARCPTDAPSGEYGLLEAWLPTFDASGHRRGDPGLLGADWSGARGGDGLDACAHAREATRQLPLDHRAVLVLRDGEGLSEGEIAEALGLPHASVRPRLHRARMALREQLALASSAR